MLNSICLIVMITILVIFSTSNKEISTGDIFDRQNTEIYRGVAIVLIMICHIVGNIGEIRFFTPLGGIGVAIFLFLSGYGLNESYKKSGLACYWEKKLLRVWLPYAIFITLIYILLGKSINGEYLLDVFCLDSTYWYIDYLMRCYLVFWVANKLSRIRWIVFLLFAVYTFFFMDAIRAEQSLSFVAGVACSANRDLIIKFSRRKLTICLILLCIIGIGALALKQTSMMRQSINSYAYCAIQLLNKFPLGMAFIITVYFIPKLKSCNFLIFCGAYSLELYLVHMRFTDYATNCIVGLSIILISMVISIGFKKSEDYVLTKYNSVKLKLFSNGDK